jgi:TonB-linked SusC/RagA family outer membrane protein
MKHFVSLLILISISLATAVAQSVRGTVVDTSGEPVPGASVVVTGTTVGSITDIDGNFSITGVAPSGHLDVSFVGYVTNKVAYRSGQNLRIVLEEDNKMLEEVVAVGYGTQKKANLTGSVANVDNKLLDNRPLTNLSSGLAGLLPGVSVVQTSGQPGSDIGTINIRGLGTFNVSAPLVIIDGFEGTMNDVNPNDVASISVLKDAASSSIYGSKAANGVILITTKRGESGKAKVTYQGLVGMTNTTNNPEFMSSAEIAEIWNQARQSVGLAPQYTDDEVRKFRDGSDPDNYANTDWQDLLYKTGMQTSHNVTVSGGNEYGKYLASIGYLYQNGVVDNYNKHQTSARINLDAKPSEKIETSFSINYMRQSVNEPLPSYNQTSGDINEFGSTNSVYQIFRQINVISPMVPYKYSDGSYGSISDGNPIAWVESGAHGNNIISNLHGIASAKYYIVPSFSVKVAGSYNRHEKESNQHNLRVKYHSGSQGSTYVSETHSNYDRSSIEVIPEFKKSFGSHNVNVLAGYHAELYKYRYTYLYTSGLPNDVLTDLDAGSPSTEDLSGYTREHALMSWFGRVAYDWKGRYLLEFNARYDGSSRFTKGNRWGFFPSVSAGWRISDESFFDGLRGLISNAKIRGSWGQLGNEDVNGSFYPTVFTMDLGYGNHFAGTYENGAKTVKATNTGLKWETATTWGIGLDATVWKFDVTLDWYNRTTKDILLSVPVPITYALTGYVDNIGKVRNQGIEFAVNYNDKFGPVRFQFGVNGCYNMNEVLNLGINYSNGEAVEYIPLGYDQYSCRDVVGMAMNQFYGYAVDGFLNENETKSYAEGGWADYEGSSIRRAGDLKYVDQNGDGKINADDRVYLGSQDPKFTFGFHLNLGWKNWDLIAFFQGAANVHRYMADALGGLGNSDTKLNTIWRDSYIVKGEGAKYPNLGIPGQNYSGNGGQNSFWLQNASYVRMKDLQLGYNVPRSVLNKIGITACRIYYSGQNLFTISGMIKGFDPEMPSGRGNGYPQTVVNSLGVNITF